MPPESCAGYLTPASTGRPTIRNRSSARLCSVDSASASDSTTGRMMFSVTVSDVNSAPCWNVTP